MSIERHRLQREKNAGAYMEPAPDGNWVAYSDHAAELAKLEDDYLKLNNIACEMRTRAERAEAYVAEQNKHMEILRSDRDYEFELADKYLKANALLRAECEAWRKADARHDWLRDNHACTHEVGDVEAAVFATDAAGILKGGE